MKKASAMLDGNSSIHRCHRLYYAYLSRTSSSWGPGSMGVSGAPNSARSNAVATGDAAAIVEHTFGRPHVLSKLGQYIMDIKVKNKLYSV